MIKFTRTALSKTPAGKLIENQQVLTRKEAFREKIINDPNMIKRGYKHGWIQLGERVLFVRSRWDGNIAAYFEYLKAKNQIKHWTYEPTTFWFHKIKRGTNNYKPDFLIVENDGREHYVEVKAFWTKKDSVKLARMAKYYKEVEISILADTKCFERMETEFPELKFKRYEAYDYIKRNALFIPGWDKEFLKREQIEHLIPLKTKPERKLKAVI